MARDSPIQGYCSPKFREVTTAFANNFAEFEELVAAFCVYVGNEKVVDLWGRWADSPKPAPGSKTPSPDSIQSVKASCHFVHYEQPINMALN